MITGEKIFDLPFYNAKGILTGGDVFGPRYRIAKLTVEEAPEKERRPIILMSVCGTEAHAMRRHRREKEPTDSFRSMRMAGKLSLRG